MKAMKNWFARRGALPITAYLLALAAWLVLGAFSKIKSRHVTASF